MNKENPLVPSTHTPKRRKEREVANLSGKLQQSQPASTNGNPSVSVPNRSNIKPSYNCVKNDEKPGDVPNSDIAHQIDVSRLTQNLTKMIFQNDNHYCTAKRSNEYPKTDNATSSNNSYAKGKKATMLSNDTQTQQVKKILVDCLQNIDRKLDHNSKEKQNSKFANHKSFGMIDKYTDDNAIDPISIISPMSNTQKTTKASLLRSYLSGSNPAREEYISKRSNVPNSLISTDSVHHSILLESGRERRQCLLQYLSNVVGDGQVVIYVNSIPGAEALMSFLKKHGFQVNAVHPRLLLAESNWILSEFSLKKFSVLLCAEDHYHSCPAHFRWVKTIINYELPICNPMENWSIRNGIVEFSDNLPVHIYTLIKKACPLDNELVKLLRLDSQDDQEILPVVL